MEIYHHGVKGMHWGVRRYQNKDGSLTKAGKKRALKEVNNVFSYRRKGIPTEHSRMMARELIKDASIVSAKKQLTEREEKMGSIVKGINSQMKKLNYSDYEFKTYLQDHPDKAAEHNKAYNECVEAGRKYTQTIANSYIKYNGQRLYNKLTPAGKHEVEFLVSDELRKLSKVN